MLNVRRGDRVALVYPTSFDFVFSFFGVLLVLAAWWLRGGHEKTGLRLGTFGLLIALTMVNLLIFYFDQFATITLSGVQFLLLVGLLRYRRRFPI